MKYLYPKPYTLNPNRGLVLLPTILALGFVALTIALTGLFIVYTLNRSNYGIRLSAAALAAADSGVKDAYLKSLRSGFPCDCSGLEYDPNVQTSDCNYTLSINSSDAYICVDTSLTKYVVYSRGKAFFKQRKLKAILDIDPVTKQVRLQSINEVPL